MQQQIGIVKDISGQFKATDKDGNVRILKIGDAIYEGDEVSALHAGEDTSTANSVTSNTDTNYFVLIEGLQTGKTYLIPQNGYRHFETQDMGKDEGNIAPQILSHTQPPESIEHDHAQRLPESNTFLAAQEVFHAPTRQSNDLLDTPLAGEEIPTDNALLDDVFDTDTPAEEPAPIPNETPVITSVATDTGTVTERVNTHASPTRHTQTGSFTFTDADPSDTHTVTATARAGGYIGTLTPTVDQATGEVNWEFSAKDEDLDSLYEGQELKQVYTITVDDGHGGTASQDVTITIHGKNDAPHAVADSPVAVAGVNASGNVLANDSDVDNGDTISVTGFTVADNTGTFTVGSPFTIKKGTATAGVLTLNSDGTYEFVADSNFHGTVPDITYTVTDGHGGTDTALLKISVIDDSAPLLDLNSGASLTDPDTAWVATYTEDGPAVSIADTDMGINTNNGGDIYKATITLTNKQTGDVLNTGGIDSNTFAVNTTEAGGKITVTITAQTGQTPTKADFETAIKAVTFSSTDNNPNLTDRTINVQVEDAPGVGHSESNVAVSTITVHAANDAPTIDAGNDAGTVTEAGHTDAGVVTAGTPAASATLASSDVDNGDTATWSIKGSAAGTYGSIAIDSNSGQWTYTLDNDNAATQALKEGENATETFTAKVTDSGGATAEKTITVTVNGANDKPEITSNAAAAKGSVTEAGSNDDGTAIPGSPTATGILTSSDVDVDTTAANNGSTWSVNTTPTGTNTTPYGNITIDPATGRWTYTLDNSLAATQALKEGDSIEQTFTATVTDDKGASTTETITVTIIGSNDAPVVQADTNSVAEDGTTTATGNVIANDSDADTGDAITVTNIAAGSTAGATDNVTPGTTSADGTEVTGTYGTLKIGADGTYSYNLDNASNTVQSLAEGETGTETFTYTVTDKEGATQSTTLTITVTGANDTPQITVTGTDTDSAAINETDTTLTATGTLTLTDVDTSNTVTTSVESVAKTGSYNGPLPADDDLKAMFTVTGGLNNTQSSSEHGVGWSFNSGSESFNSIPKDETVVLTYTVKADDGNGGTTTHPVTITITGTNDAPVLVADTDFITEDATTATTGNVLTNDSDVDDGDTLNVVGVVKGSQTSNLEDANTVAAGVTGDYGTVTINADGTYSYSLDNNNPAVQALGVGETLTETFTYTASDGNGGVKHTTLTITINGANDDPVVQADTNSVTEDAADAAGHNDSSTNTTIVAGDVLDNDSDADSNDTLSVVGVVKGDTNANSTDAATVNAGVAGDYGTVTIKADGTYEYALDNNNSNVQALAVGQNLTDTFTYTASDDNGGVKHTTLTITINGANDAPVVQADTNSVTEDTAATATGNVITGVAGGSPASDTMKDTDADNGDVLTVTSIAAGTTAGTTDNVTAGTNSTTNPTEVAGTYGTLKIGADGSYSYTLGDASQNLAEGQQATDTFTYTVKDSQGVAQSTTLTIDITGTNDAPVISKTGTDTDSAGLTENNIAAVTASGTLSIKDVDTTDTVTASVEDSLTVGGDFTSSNLPAGVTLAELKAMLTVNSPVLGNNATENEHGIRWNFNAGDEHFDSMQAGNTLELTYTVKVDDGNGGTVTHPVTITITGTNDSGELGTAITTSTDEDINLVKNVFTQSNATEDPDANESLTVSTFTIAGMSGIHNAGNTPVTVKDSANNTIGTFTLKTNGDYTFDPANDYSGPVPQITYSATNGGTQSLGSATLDITVNPVSDAPTMGAAVAVSTDEDNAIALNKVTGGGTTNWKLPTITDNADYNGNDAGDSPERLGLLELSGLTAGTKIQDGSGNDLYTAANGSPVTIKIVDAGLPNYHTTQAQSASATLTLTQAEFNALKILPKPNSSKDLNLTLTATEYEVDASGGKLANVNGAEAAQNIKVTVNPITDSDDFNLTANTPAPSGNEDDAINLKNAFNFDQSVDADKSEHYKLNFSCDNDGRVEFKFKNGSWESLSDFNNAGHDFTGGAMPDVYVRTKGNDSRDIKNLELTLTAQDHDEDNSSQTDSTTYVKSATISNIAITPVANDITLKEASPSGNEDTRIAMGLDFTNNDGPTGTAKQEVVDHLVISSIPADAKIYNGTSLVFTGNGSNEFNTGNLSTAEIKGLTILPPQDFSGKINLKVKVYSKDTDDDTSDSTQVTTQDPTEVTHTITVKGVVDTSTGTGANPWTEGDNEASDSGHLYVKIGGTEVTGNSATETHLTGTEDNPVALGMSWQSYEAKDHSTNDNSEKAEFVIAAQSGETDTFTIVDGSGAQIGTKVSGGWKLTADQLKVAQVKAAKDFAGDLDLQLKTTVKDGEDTNTQTDKFKVTFAPETDTPVLQLTDVYATEDTPTKFDIFPQTTDIDSSEIVTKMELSSIPSGVKFFIKEGTTYTEISYTGNDLTLTIDDTTQDIAAGKISHDQLKELHIQAPKDSNTQFSVAVKPTVQDGSAIEATIAPKTVKVFVKGDADTPEFDNTNSSISGDEYQGGTDFIDISSLKAQSGETANDGSEILTYVLHGLDKAFKPVDASGKIIGDFISTSGGKVNWSFTQDQMNNLHIKAPQYFSGTLSGLKLETIAVENDGDTAKAERTFNLVVQPKVSTSDPVGHSYTAKEPVTLHEGNNATPTHKDSTVALNFTNTIDNETVTKVEIDTVPNGVVLGIDNGGTVTEATPSGGTYTFTGADIGKVVAIIKGDGILANKTDDITLGGIKVWIEDAGDAGQVGLTAAQTDAAGKSVGDITITVEGQADQPYVQISSSVNASGNANDVTITGTFPDSDGEEHYYIIHTQNDVLLNNGTNQGNGIWYLTDDDLTGLQAYVPGNSSTTVDISVTAYAVENGKQVNTATTTLTGNDTDTGSSWQGEVADMPTLAVKSETSDEDSTFNLNKLIDKAGTHTNDAVPGTAETLAFIIKIPTATLNNLESFTGLQEFKMKDGSTAYRFDAGSGSLQQALENITFTPKENFSGDLSFGIIAVANEPGVPISVAFAQSAEQTATITINPVAEGALSVAAEGGLASSVDEDSSTLVKLTFSSADKSNLESFSDIRLSLDSGQGTFVDADGNSLGTSLSGLTYDQSTHTLTTGNDKLVHYQPPENKGGSFTIKVTADITDDNGGNGTPHTTQDAAGSISVNVTPIPDSGTFTLTDGTSTTPLNTTDNKLSVNEDGKVKLDIHSDFDDDDHSEFQTILIKDVPAGMLFYDENNALVGEINATSSTGNTWKLPLDVMNGKLFIKPPLHYTDDITLKVVGVAMEQDNMGEDQSHEQSFTLDITPVANGATIFPQNASGEEDVPTQIDLGAKLVAKEEIDTVGLTHTINETYNVTFTGAGDDITLYYKDASGYHTLTNTDSGNNYTVEDLTQAQIDALCVRVNDGETGSFSWDISVTTTDGNNTSAAVTGTVGIAVSTASDTKTITIDGKSVTFGRSGDDTLDGDDNVNIIDGGVGNDTIDGKGGADEIYGGIGNDTIILDKSDAKIDGGKGEDSLKVEGNVDFTSLANDLIHDMEVIDLSNNSQQTIDLDAPHIKAMSGDDNTLLVKGDTADGAKDTVNLEHGWTDNGTTQIDGITYHVLNNAENDAHLKIQHGVEYNIA